MKVIGFNKKNLIALAMAVVLAATSFGVYQAQAAGKVDTDADVIITANVSEQEAFYKNYSKYNGKYDVEIKLYKLASVDESGQIGKCNLTGVDLTALSANKVTVADVKKKIVEPAVKAVGKKADETITVKMSDNKTSGSVKIEKGAGVYLYIPQDVQDERYTYHFTPYIIMVPNSDYITGVEEDAAVRQGYDTWKMNEDETAYIASFNLKADFEQRYVDLEIYKNLERYNWSLNEATFIYEVTATYGDKKDSEGKDIPVYKDYFSIEYFPSDNWIPSTGTITVPAGTNVTITEVYTGASYDTVKEEGKDTHVQTIEKISAEDEYYSVTFTNDYDNELQVGGSSIVNHYEVVDGKYEFRNIEEEAMR